MLLRQLAFSMTCPDPECQTDLSDRTDSSGHLHITLGTWSQYVHLPVYGRYKKSCIYPTPQLDHKFSKVSTAALISQLHTPSSSTKKSQCSYHWSVHSGDPSPTPRGLHELTAWLAADYQTTSRLAAYLLMLTNLPLKSHALILSPQSNQLGKNGDLEIHG